MTSDTMLHLFATVVVIGQALWLVSFVVWLGRRSWGKRLVAVLQEYGLLAGFVVAAVSMGGSLYFSQVAHFVPCELCWFQRIVMYPQVALFGLALLKKNRDVFWQIITLSIIGSAIAIYHYYLQLGGTPFTSCGGGEAVDCAKKVTMIFGYVTIPLMALTGFLLTIMAAVFHRETTKTLNEQPIGTDQ
jgi:disulfide bond formation protein DsbB